MKHVAILAIFAVLAIPTSNEAAEATGAGTELRGAEAFLADLAVAPEKSKKITNPGKKLLADIQAFSKLDTLSPEKAAFLWLALYDRIQAIPLQQRYQIRDEKTQQHLDIGLLMQSLPGPEAWGELRRQIEKRPTDQKATRLREAGLQLMAHALDGDMEAQKADITKIAKLAGELDKNQKQSVKSTLSTLAKHMRETTGDTSGFLESLRIQAREISKQNRQGDLRLPNLWNQVDAKDAEALLREVLVMKNVSLTIEGTTSQKTTRALALELIDDLKTPQWSLINSLDAIPLYEAMEKRFKGSAEAKGDANAASTAEDLEDQLEIIMSGDAGDAAVFLNQMQNQNDNITDHYKNAAKGYYLLALIAHDRTEDATKLATALKNEKDFLISNWQAMMSALEEAGYQRQVHAFLHKVLTDDAALPLWSQYISLSAALDASDAAVQLTQDSLKDAGLDDDTRFALREQLLAALYAKDDLDGGAALALDLLKTDFPARIKASKENAIDAALRTAVRVARIGHYVGNKNWLTSGIKQAEALMKQQAESAQQQQYGGYYGISYDDDEGLLGLYLELERFADAESLILDTMKRLAAASQSDPDMMGYIDTDSTRETLIGLCQVYAKAGRPNDIIILLEKSDQWGAADIADVLNESYEHESSAIIAAALHKAGKTDAAVAILESALREATGVDALYAEYVAIRGKDALPFFETLINRDRFEERPLIWKAHILRTQGNLDEALSVAKSAIAIDPSDGEQGRGDRMRVYAEMAEIMRAQKNDTKAAFFDNVIKAIRLAEDADRLYAAGLLSRGIKQYRESLTYFSDAYCIQSRLAIQLEQTGNFAEAAKRYETAYELMPDSFGRIESHCFGCEGVFRTDRAQGIAERVFISLTKKTPEKPQVHYLLGYLRSQQGRYAEAAALFEKATTLDPDYLNAWNKRNEMARHIKPNPEQRDNTVINMLRLDPLQRHHSADLSQVVDLRRVAAAFAQSDALRVESPKTIYALPASAKKVAEMEEKMKAMGDSSHHYSRSYYRDSQTFAQRLLQHQVIQSAIQLQSISSEMSGYGGYGFGF